jgi:hypothetical protein
LEVFEETMVAGWELNGLFGEFPYWPLHPPKRKAWKGWTKGESPNGENI